MLSLFLRRGLPLLLLGSLSLSSCVTTAHRGYGPPPSRHYYHGHGRPVGPPPPRPYHHY